MRIELIAFTGSGCQLAEKLTDLLTEQGHDAAFTPCRGESHISLKSWTALAFKEAEALIFVGAAGIAVRAIAPFVQSKTHDPAVLVADEAGNYLIPLLSGHLGGANALAAQLAPLFGAQPIITTATDLRDLWAVDTWAKQNGCALINPGRIKTISGRLLEGSRVLLYSDFPLEGTAPEYVTLTQNRAEAHAVLSLNCVPWTLSSPLLITPRIGVLGVGCRRGISEDAIRWAVREFLGELKIQLPTLCALASLDLKKDEDGLLSFAESLKLPIHFYSADTLAAVPGCFTGSEFVLQTTGVDNVCERAAVQASEGGSLYAVKHSYPDVTLALALRPFRAGFQQKGT